MDCPPGQKKSNCQWRFDYILEWNFHQIYSISDSHTKALISRLSLKPSVEST